MSAWAIAGPNPSGKWNAPMPAATVDRGLNILAWVLLGLLASSFLVVHGLSVDHLKHPYDIWRSVRIAWVVFAVLPAAYLVYRLVFRQEGSARKLYGLFVAILLPAASVGAVMLADQYARRNPTFLFFGQDWTREVFLAQCLVAAVLVELQRPVLRLFGVEVPRVAEGRRDLPLPEGAPRWNWGAMLLNYFWALTQRVWIGVLILVPYVQWAVPFVLGWKGSEWAWRNNDWRDAEHFLGVQRRWSRAGVAVILVLAGWYFVAEPLSIVNSDVFRQSWKHINAHEEVRETFGEIEKPFIGVHVMRRVRNERGFMSMGYVLDGEKTFGRARIHAVYGDGSWTITRIDVRVEGEDRRIRVLSPPRPQAAPKVYLQ